MRTIYLDYNATTPLDQEVRKAMLPLLEDLQGNPSSIHHVGRKARAVLDEARYRVSAVWRCKPSEVIFTSGGTESNNLAILGTARLLKSKGRHLITSQVEHHAVLHCFDYLERKEGFEITRLPVDHEGFLDPLTIEKAIRADTVLVSVMAANNEVGTLQDVAAIGKLCRRKGVVFHTDAVQWFGKEPVPSIDCFQADLVSVCCHKFHGPKGAGALFVRSPLLPDPLMHGGGHENERRAGTENLLAIWGFMEALERFTVTPVFPGVRLREQTQHLRRALGENPYVKALGPKERRLTNTAAFTVSGTDSFALLAGLDIEGICASSGSACAAGSLEPSHVVLAMGASREASRSLLRFSLGRETTEQDISTLVEIFPRIVDRSVGVRG